LRSGWYVIWLQENKHAYTSTAKENGTGKRLAFIVLDVCGEFHEAEFLAEAINGLDGDGPECVR